jgi:heptosyltransferase-2
LVKFSNRGTDKLKPKILVPELWGIGDLALVCPFLNAAAQRYEVTLLAKPFAQQFSPHFFRGVEILFLNAPWTAFKGKYQLHHWPWGELSKTIAELRSRQFDVAVSARFDPRDHLLIWLAGAKRRLGFPRMGSNIFLTTGFATTQPPMHRFSAWKMLAGQLGLELPGVPVQHTRCDVDAIVVHTGAGHPVRVWPLPKYAWIVEQLRKQNYRVQVVCDPDQVAWWRAHDETGAVAPRDLAELTAVLEGSRVFIGNDSGPGHVAALLGIPTFTIFGPQLPESFAPIHSRSEWSTGKPCDFKPCHDYCHFDSPRCLVDLTEQEVWPRIDAFARRSVLVEETC